MSKQERAASYYREGRSLRSIAGTFHVSHIAIRNWLLAQGVRLRPQGRRS